MSSWLRSLEGPLKRLTNEGFSTEFHSMSRITNLDKPVDEDAWRAEELSWLRECNKRLRARVLELEGDLDEARLKIEELKDRGRGDFSCPF